MRRVFLLSAFLFAAAAFALLQTETCTPAGNARLEILELRAGSFQNPNLIEGFDPDALLYQVVFPESQTTGLLWAKAQDPSAIAEVFYRGAPVTFTWDSVASLDVPMGQSEVTIKVSVDTGGSSPYSWTYRVQIQRGDLCDGVVCDDQDDCTEDVCDPFTGGCEGTAVEDGTPCAERQGRCYGGECNFVPVSVSIGPKEVVFDWTTDRCEDLDLPDSPAHAIRAEDSELVLFANNAPNNYVSRGPDFDTLQHVCDPPALVSADLRTPETYENWEWIWATYREGDNWHALVLNEFHDTLAPTCKPGDPSPANPCTYWSITYAVSTDGARTFVKPSPPAHVVAPPPQAWAPPINQATEWLQEGYGALSAIVRGSDGYYYALVGLFESIYNKAYRQCLMRTDTLDDPASWRAWDGNGFNVRMESPYAIGETAPFCVALPSHPGGAGLTYNSYLGLYMNVGGGGSPFGDNPCGIYVWFSNDLIHWSEPQLIIETAFMWGACATIPPTPDMLEQVPTHFHTIIDHADSSPNFERPGRTPYLYYTRYNNNGGLDRDLVRVPLRFTMGGPLCEGIDCDDANVCTEDVCNGADGSCEHTPIDCDDSNECTIDTCSPAVGCQHTAVADGTLCAGGTCQDGSCAGYTQDFESLDQASPTALSDDGWLIYANVFEADGTTFVRGYGPFPAPNGGPAFCGIDTTGKGGPEQGAQQLSIYSDYNNLDDQMAGRRVEANTYRERLITAWDVGKTVTFSFDARRGNINDAAEPACINTTNPPCDSTALAFIKTIDPNAGFVTTSLVEQDTTDLPTTWDRYSIELVIDPGLVGQLLQFGYSATASNFEPAGVLYDNILVGTTAP